MVVVLFKRLALRNSSTDNGVLMLAIKIMHFGNNCTVSNSKINKPYPISEVSSQLFVCIYLCSLYYIH